MQSETPQLVTWQDEDMTITLYTIFAHPKKAAIIASNKSASSAETFIEGFLLIPYWKTMSAVEFL